VSGGNMVGSRNFIIIGVTITTVNTELMISFYNSVFNTRLKPVPLGEFNIYQGRLGELDITLIPTNSIDTPTLNSRYQLSFQVNGLEEMVERIRLFGGTPLEHIYQDGGDKYCGIADPDGNTIELLENATTPILER